MGFVFLAMLAMIGVSILLELILPTRAKQRLGTLICWIMMFVTMACLSLAALGLVWVTTQNFILPLFA